MKTLIVFVIIFGLLATGCTTTYLNLKENSTAQIEEKIIDYQADEDVGAEVTLSIKNGKEISGELLSVRENSVTICTEYSATEQELSNRKYPINKVQNDEINEITIEGSNCVWIGFAIGSATFTGIGIWIGHELEKGLDAEGGKAGLGIIGFFVGAIAGGIVGYLLSTDNVILKDIPPEYDFSLLKSLARYPDEEPKYLRAIP